VTTIAKPTLFSPTYILPTQMRLAEIVEMIHTASLLHDDVIDVSSLRRGVPSAPATFGNKLTVLGGNFVIGRATTALARLRDIETTGLISCGLSNLVDGEFLQMREVEVGEGGETDGQQQRLRKDAWLVYLQKTYMKTGSLIAKSAKAAVILGGCLQDIWPEIAYAYGRNLGIAFQVCILWCIMLHCCSTHMPVFLDLQLIDDILDYETVSTTLGKPSGADLQLGLATGPALYAWEEHQEMGELIQRKFRKTGDVKLVGIRCLYWLITVLISPQARDYVTRSSALQRSRVLAQRYADKATEILAQLPDSEAKTGLEMLAKIVIGRKN
jgi:hexaprenyl-diphosphate synthase